MWSPAQDLSTTSIIREMVMAALNGRTAILIILKIRARPQRIRHLSILPEHTIMQDGMKYTRMVLRRRNRTSLVSEQTIILRSGSTGRKMGYIISNTMRL